MSLRFPLVLSVLFSLLLCGCSTLTEFVIVNSTDKPVTVRLVFTGNNHDTFKTSTTAQLEESDKKWNDLSAEEVQFDEENRAYTLSLPADHALLVTTEINYSGHEHELFPISEIILSQDEDVKEFKGKSAQLAFQTKKNGSYRLVYRP